jgi:hypothetical protein
MNGYPPEVQGFHDVLQRIPGLVRADTTLSGLEQIGTADLSQIELADLPHAVLRRTTGMRGEGLIQIDFAVESNARGWRALEFMAWAIKDLARAGELVQLRPLALPPMVFNEIQLGRTLRFVIDIFVMLNGEVEPALKKLATLTATFETYLQLYGAALHTGDTIASA